jgi:hypothetical protein
MPGESVKDYGGKILVTALFGAESQIEELRRMGVKDEQMIIL